MILRTLFAAVALCGGLLLAQDHGDKPQGDKKPAAEPKVEHRAARRGEALRRRHASTWEFAFCDLNLSDLSNFRRRRATAPG